MSEKINPQALKPIKKFPTMVAATGQNFSAGQYRRKTAPCLTSPPVESVPNFSDEIMSTHFCLPPVPRREPPR